MTVIVYDLIIVEEERTHDFLYTDKINPAS